MNSSNKDSNCYTKGNQMFYQNYGIPQKPFHSQYNIPAGMQTGVPMFPLYGYDNSQDFDKDVTYMKQLYPKAVLQIQKEVDEECDKLEYDGSCMFDECPDKNHLSMIIDTIYSRVIILDNDSVKAEQYDPYSPPYYPCDPRDRDCPPRPRPRPYPRPDYNPHGGPDWLRSLIGILLFNEMNQRRRRYRSRKRWF